MNSCSRSDDVLAYLTGLLEGEEKALFEKHLEDCPACRRELDLERALQSGLSECTLPDAAPAELRPAVLAGMLTVRRPRFPFWQIGATVAAGTAAFLALLHVLAGSGLPEAGAGLLARAASSLSSMFSGTGSLPVMIGTGLVLVGIASVLASLVPED
jgi:anti-sigma factor (TIGR02949 family)